MVLKKIPNWENPSRAIAPLSRPRGRNRSRSIKLCEVGLTLEFLFLTGGVETYEKIVKKGRSQRDTGGTGRAKGKKILNEIDENLDLDQI